jgi:hypothetical protein
MNVLRLHERKICQTCGVEFQPTGSCQKFCPECKPTPAERTVQWRIEHPERAKASRDAWDLVHPLKEYHKAYSLRWDPLHRHERVVSARRWQKKNPEKVREANRKHCAKRRALGFNPLNASFAGAEPHHVNQVDVIYVPAALHDSVWHNVWTGKNMEQMNKLAFAYLGGS